MKKIIIATIIILAISTWVVIVYSTQPKQSSGQLASPKPAVGSQESSSDGETTSSAPNDNQILSAISKKTPALFSNGSPKFTIVKKQAPLTNWSIVTLRMKDGYAQDQKVILFQQSPNVAPTIMQGPGAELLNLSGLPIEVREAMREV